MKTKEEIEQLAEIHANREMEVYKSMDLPKGTKQAIFTHCLVSYNIAYTQCQEDMARKEIQPEDIWNKENQEKIKEHILNQARKQTTEDILETELAAKKYTLEDIENAFNSGRGYGVPDNIKDFNSFINSLNKQD